MTQTAQPAWYATLKKGDWIVCIQTSPAFISNRQEGDMLRCHSASKTHIHYLGRTARRECSSPSVSSFRKATPEEVTEAQKAYDDGEYPIKVNNKKWYKNLKAGDYVVTLVKNFDNRQSGEILEIFQKYKNNTIHYLSNRAKYRECTSYKIDEFRPVTVEERKKIEEFKAVRHTVPRFIKDLENIKGPKDGVEVPNVTSMMPKECNNISVDWLEAWTIGPSTDNTQLRTKKHNFF